MSVVIPHSARCAQCGQMVELDSSGCFKRHELWQDAVTSDLAVGGLCDAVGQKAPIVQERETKETKKLLARIEKKYAELELKKKELQPAAESFLNGKGLNAETFCGLLQAYRLWDSIPPRRKGHIKKKLICIGYCNNEISIIMRNKALSKGISRLAEALVKALTRTPQ